MKKTLLTSLCVSLLLSTAIAAGTAAYSGNVKSKIFHRSSCRYFASKSCTASFSSREAAIHAGYRACKVCKP